MVDIEEIRKKQKLEEKILSSYVVFPNNQNNKMEEERKNNLDESPKKMDDNSFKIFASDTFENNFSSEELAFMFSGIVPIFLTIFFMASSFNESTYSESFCVCSKNFPDLENSYNLSKKTLNMFLSIVLFRPVLRRL